MDEGTFPKVIELIYGRAYTLLRKELPMEELDVDLRK